MSFHRAVAKIRRVFSFRRRDDLAEEMAAHLAIEERENVANGMSPDEAHYAALRTFGNVTASAERSRALWGWTFLEQCAQDVRYSWAGLRRQPLFAVSAIAMLTLGITAVTVVFSIVDAVLLRPSSFISPASTVQIEQWHDDRSWGSIRPSLFTLLRERRDLFPQLIAEGRGMLTVTHVPVPDQMFAQLVTGNLFSLLPARPLYGRTLQPSDESASAPSVIVLSYHAWQQLFAGDPSVIGKTAEVDGRATTVIGVMPETFVMPGRAADLWMPLRLTPADMNGENAVWETTLALLNPNLSAKSAQTALDTIASTLNKQRDPKQQAMHLRASIWQPESNTTRNIILWLALGTVFGLLAIGCANVSSLLLARGLSRRRDYAIRIATGASHTRLMRQSFLEALLLSSTGLVLGLLTSGAILRFLRESRNLRALQIPDLAHAHIDLRVVALSFGVSTIAAILSAGLPAWLIASMALSDGLRESGTHSATGYRVRRLMFSLTGLQAGICMTLLLVSSLLTSSLFRLLHDDHGFRPDHILTLRLPYGSWFPGARTPADRQKQSQRYLNLLDRVRSLNGVVSAALTSSLPLSNVRVSTHLHTPSESARSDNSLMLMGTRAVSPDYFRVMGIPLAAGRSFQASDDPTRKKVVMVNQAFVDRYFHGANAIGRTLEGEGPADNEEIIGVIRNTAQLDLNAPAEPELFVNFNSMLTPFLTGLVVRTTASPESIAPALRRVLAEEDPRQPVVKVRTLRSLIEDNTALSRGSAWIISSFALVALILSTAGIYGVVSFATLARQRDFGIRLCLGSTRGGIFRIATWQAVVPIACGVMAGVATAWYAGRAIASILYKTSYFDAPSTLSSVLILLSIAFLAAAVPAWRSARLDPARILRND